MTEIIEGVIVDETGVSFVPAGSEIIVRSDVIELADDGSPIFSASQVDTFRLCKRKWAWRYLDGIESPPNASAALGLEVHAQLEAWLKEGTPPKTCRSSTSSVTFSDFEAKAGLIAMSSLHLLPAPRTVDTEKAFFFTLFGFRFRGFKDFERGPTTHRTNGSWISGFVGDHKTSTDPSKWGKTADDLRNDTQAILYAAEHMMRFESSSVELHWNYLRTSGTPKATPVLDAGAARPVITQGECEPVLERTYNAAKEMVALTLAATAEKGKRALDVKPNYNSCKAFGGCPYLDICPRTTADVIRSLFHMNDREALLAKMQGNPQLPPAGAANGAATNGTANGVNPPTAPGPFIEGTPFYDGKDYHVPGSPVYEGWKAFHDSKKAAEAAVVASKELSTAARAENADVSAPSNDSNGSNGAAETPFATNLAEGLKPRRGRAKKTTEGPSAVGTTVPQTNPRFAALAHLGYALHDLGDALCELAEASGGGGVDGNEKQPGQV